jgi:hypothetical protein
MEKARAAAMNDPTVVELDLRHCHLTDHDSNWIEKLLKANTVMTAWCSVCGKYNKWYARGML